MSNGVRERFSKSTKISNKLNSHFDTCARGCKNHFHYFFLIRIKNAEVYAVSSLEFDTSHWTSSNMIKGGAPVVHFFSSHFTSGGRSLAKHGPYIDNIHI